MRSRASSPEQPIESSRRFHITKSTYIDVIWQVRCSPTVSLSQAGSPAHGRFGAGWRAPFWCRTRPVTAPLASRVNVSCASTAVRKNASRFSA